MPTATPVREDAPAFLTTTELAARWRVATGTLANQRALGTGLPFIRIGRRVLYNFTDVLERETAALCTP